MKKLISIVLTLTVVISLFSLFSLSFGAYTATPITDENGNYTGPLTDENGRTQKEAIEYFKDNLHMGDWVPCVNTEEDVKTMAENGIQFTFLWSFSYDNPQSVQQLLWCMKYGIKVFLMDTHITKSPWNSNEKNSVEEMKKTIKPSINNPYILGYDLWDEPAKTEGYPDLINFVNNFKTAAENNLIAFVNLFPWVNDSYGKEYLDGSFTALGLDHVSVDIYPYLGDRTEDYYVKNVSAAGTSAREHNGDFWLFIQSMSIIDNGKRAPELKELRQQAYVGLANGVQKMMHFCYQDPWGKGDVASVTIDGKKTPIYEYTQTVNREMKYLTPIYNQFSSTGIFTVKGSVGKTAPFMRENLFGITGQDMYINSVTSDEDLLVGKFDSKTDDRKAFVFVNVSEVMEGKATTVTFKSPSDKVTLIYEGKTETLLPDENGVYTIELNCGDGVFVICEPNLTEEEKEISAKIDEALNILAEKCHKLVATNQDIYYTPESFDNLKKNADLLTEAIINKDKEVIYKICSDIKIAAENLYTQLDYYKELAKPYLDLAQGLDPTLFEEKSWNSFKKMTDTLAQKCSTEELNGFIAIKNYLSYAERVTKKLEFIGTYGDCDRNGSIDLNDAMTLIMITAKKADLTANISYIGDIDKSGDITLNDAMRIIMFVAKKTPTL